MRGMNDTVDHQAPDHSAGFREIVGTSAGDARITWHTAGSPQPAHREQENRKQGNQGREASRGRPEQPARAVLALGHGAGGGVEARDLAALAAALPPLGVTVALVEQPWRVAGKKIAPAPKKLDAAWGDLWPALRRPGSPIVAGGRSAGARVACRTAAELGAEAVLALSFPLHPPGKPEATRLGELTEAGRPTLVVQGGRDPFGRPAEFPEDVEIVEVPEGDHGFAVPKRAAVGQDEALEVITDAVGAWLVRRGLASSGGASSRGAGGR
jgi:uncharacterized protein